MLISKDLSDVPLVPSDSANAQLVAPGLHGHLGLNIFHYSVLPDVSMRSNSWHFEARKIDPVCPLY